jgi:hypothetical protein
VTFNRINDSSVVETQTFEVFRNEVKEVTGLTVLENGINPEKSEKIKEHQSFLVTENENVATVVIQKSMYHPRII